MGRNTDDKVRGWQSDIIVDLIKRYDFEYISMNPGASFRARHFGQGDRRT